jgi:TolB protein
MIARQIVWLTSAALTLSTPVVGQDPADQGVRLGITYQPGVRPGMLVLGGDRSVVLDSARLILGRDLDYSDEFEMVTLPFGDSLALRVESASSGGGEPFVNYQLYAILGASFAVHAQTITEDSTLVVTLYDVLAERVANEVRFAALDPGDHDFRLNIHSAADEFVRFVTGTPGVASTRMLFVNQGRIYRVDSDGADAQPISSPGIEAMSPTWSPDGRHALYMEFPAFLYRHEIRTGERSLVVDDKDQNFGPDYSPDGRTMAFSKMTVEGTDIYSYNLTDACCLQRLTVGRLYDNLSPSYSPDGRRIAFTSSRLGDGFSQIYVMSADGTGQEILAPVAWGVTGASFAPDWSPDGLHVAFHRYVNRIPQIFVMDLATRTVRQLTSFGRNTDPAWAPDGRHLSFVSNRSGSRQVWIIDIKTSRIRQLTRLGQARLPSWSPRIVEQN